MKILDFVQSKDFFTVNGLKCLRGDYFHNQCNLCIDICPNNSLTIFKNKIYLEDSCINCGVCIGGCPTESLMIETFDENDYILKFEKDTISCKDDAICVACFDQNHYANLMLKQDKDISINISNCDNCELNKEDIVKNSIINRVNETNSLLEKLDIKNKLILKTDSNTNDTSRRGIFTKILNATKQIKDDSNLTKKIEEKLDKKIPTKKLLFKNRLKEFIQDDTIVSFENSFIINKTIDYDKCTNCKECVQFCPTEALTKNSVEDTIYFQIGKCVNCNICNDICKENAINNSFEDISLLDFAFDRAKELVKFELKLCKRCKCAYPSKDNRDICHICDRFEGDEFANLFVMQKDL
jgi:ferredoxin